MKVWCPVEDEPISRGDTVKGYEYAPGEYVVITDEDLENVPLKTVRSIEIEQFTKAERDDAAVRFVKSAYYLEPDKIGRKAFYLLQVGPRGGRPDGDLQGRDQGPRGARRARPVRRHDAPDHPPLARRDPLDRRARPAATRTYEFKPAELAMAKQLVSAMTGEFDPAQYKDEYREALETIIQAKVEGKETVAVEAPEESGNLIDLMAALEASVNAAKAARDASPAKPVSVAEAKAAKAAKAAQATRRPRRPRPTAEAEAEDEAPAKPARKRKTA